MTPFGWRFAAAVAGTLTVLVVVRVGRRMTGSTLLGCLAGLVLALDGLHFVQSRIAMLDVFLVLGTTAAFACLVVDRDRLRARLAAAPDEALGGWGPRTGLRPWRLAAGVCLGAALATKWSALYYVAVLGLLALAWEVGARRTAGARAPFRATLLRSAAPLAPHVAGAAGRGLPAVLDRLVPVRHRLRPHLGRRRARPGSGSCRTRCARSGTTTRACTTFHSGLSSPHPYQSHPSGWLLLARPVSYYYPPGLTVGAYGCAAESCSREVLAIGNPALWWATLPVLLACCGSGRPGATGARARCSCWCSRQSCRGSATTWTSARCSCSTRCRRCRSWRWRPRWSAAGRSAGRDASDGAPAVGGGRRRASGSRWSSRRVRLLLPGARGADDPARRLAGPHVVPELGVTGRGSRLRDVSSARLQPQDDRHRRLARRPAARAARPGQEPGDRSRRARRPRAPRDDARPA